MPEDILSFDSEEEKAVAVEEAKKTLAAVEAGVVVEKVI